jgi:Fe-S cluster assembly protein SufD
MTSPLSVDAARALDGPAWLTSLRVAAAERASAAGWPSVDEEIWRYSRIGEFDPERIGAPAGASVDVQVPEAATRRGVTVAAAASVDDLPEPTTDAFADWAAAFADAIVVRVPRGVAIEEPVVVEHRVGSGLHATRLVVLAEEDAEIRIIERFVGGGPGSLVLPLTQVQAARAARVRHLGLNHLDRAAWSIGSLVARGEADSSTRLGAVAFGGDYARLRIEARVQGRGASGEQIAVYFGEGRQMHDFRTLQDHAAPKTTSNLLFKGAVQDDSTSVYTGLIKVRKEAPGTSAFQTNRTIKLSAGAWAESVPNLDIETNDVRCSHASAVGPIDEDQRFYLESRGVPPEFAERLVVLGFFAEVIDALPVAGEASALRAEVAAKLARRHAEEASR